MARESRPGSILWLLAHDARLAWRDFRATFGALGNHALALLFLLLLAIMHAAAWPIASQFGALADDPATRAAAYAKAAPVVLFFLLLMVAQTLNGVTKLLYVRGDLELMFSSPLSPRKVLFVRALAVAGGALTSAGIFVVPLADAGLMTGHWGFAGAYPALLGAALLAAAAGLVVAMGLFSLIGPRMTRLAAQILATFIGAGFMLGLQLRHVLPWLSPAALFADPSSTAGGAARLLLWPVRAAMGEPRSLAAWLIFTAGVFSLVCGVLGRRFAKDASIATSVTPRGFPRTAQARTGPRRHARPALPVRSAAALWPACGGRNGD